MSQSNFYRDDEDIWQTSAKQTDEIKVGQTIDVYILI